MNNIRWSIGKHHTNNKWTVYKYGKVVKFYDSREEAQEECARCVEDDQWHAANRD